MVLFQKKLIMVHNCLKILTNILICCFFFIPWKMLEIWYIFAANSYGFLAKSIKKYCKSTRYTRCSAGCWDLCSSFENINVTCATVGRNTTNHSLEEENALSFKVFGGKVTFFPMFWLWKRIIFYQKWNQRFASLINWNITFTQKFWTQFWKPWILES